MPKHLPQLLAVAMLIVGLLITYGLWSTAQMQARKVLQGEFDYRVREISGDILQRMATYEEVLRATKGFLRGSVNVKRTEFRTFANTLRLHERFPGIQAVAISAIVSKSELQRHVAVIRSEGFPDYRVRPYGEREIYTAITHIEPFNAMNQRAFGFDMFSEPVRRAAMAQARDMRQATLSGKVQLVQEAQTNAQPGFLLYLPVYRRGMPVNTVAERQEHILGWVYAPFRVNDFMAGVAGDRLKALQMRIFDGKEVTSDHCLFGCAITPVPAALFKTIKHIDIAGRTWTLEISSEPGFESKRNTERARWIGMTGLAASILLAVLAWALASSRQRALWLALDMTQELRTSEFRWKYALEGAGDGVWDWNTQTGEVIYSKRWKEMLGYANGDIGNSISEWEKRIHPIDQAHTLAAAEDYLNGRIATYAVEHRLQRADGSWIWILTRGMAVRRDAEGRPMRIIGTHTDITASKINEQALRESHAQVQAEQRRIKSILANSHDAFIAIDENGIITDWNTQAERTFGWPESETVGKPLADFIRGEDQPSLYLRHLDHFLRHGPDNLPGRRLETVVYHRGNKCIPIELTAAVVRTDAGRVAHAFIRDITERKEAEQREAQRQQALEEARAAMQHAQKLEAVGKLTGGVAHDFNNVLQIISGNIQLLMSAPLNEEQKAARLYSALEAVERGSKLSSQLLSFARRQPLQPMVVNIRRLVRNMDDMLRRILGESIEIETIIAGGLWNTMVDPYQLENVILNLAINARDAMQEGGKLTIELGNAMLDDEYVLSQPDVPAGQYVVLAVSDTGSGMSAEVLERAFDPFFTTKPEGVGTGLGLSMAYGFVKQSGGHIRLYSEIGQGTTVRIYLPRSFEREQDLPSITNKIPEGGSESILVVEDDVSVQATVVAMLADLGYKVLKADNGEQALEIVKSGVPIDLLFTDVVMPGSVRSPELAKLAKSLRPGLRILFTSGYTQNAIVHGGRLDPGVHLLSKPYRRDQLARKIRELLDDMPANLSA